METKEGSLETKTKNITLSSILGWIIGTLCILSGVMFLTSNILLSIIYFLIACITFPPLYKVLRNKTHIHLSKAVRVVLILILFMIAGLTFMQKGKDVSEAMKVVSDVQTKVEDKKDATYQQVFTFNGTGTKKSEPFTITGTRFKITYDCKGDLCQAFLHKVDSQMPQLIMNSAGTVKDETIMYGAGEYYIDANTMGSYTMTVYDYK